MSLLIIIGYQYPKYVKTCTAYLYDDFAIYIPLIRAAFIIIILVCGAGFNIFWILIADDYQ